MFILRVYEIFFTYFLIFQALVSGFSTVINLYCILCCILTKDMRNRNYYLIGLQSLCDFVSSVVSVAWGILNHLDQFTFFCSTNLYDQSYNSNYPVNRNLVHFDKNILNLGKSCQDLAMVLTKKTPRYVRTCKFFAWLSRNKILARFPRKINHDIVRYIKY